MTEQSDLSRDRIEIALDRGTRIVRLLTWTAMFVLVCLMLWLVSGMVAKAEDPKAAARAIGQAGAAAAGAVARDASQAGEVPGYAGTNVPERNIGANRLQHEGRARLADPDDPGGAAGRAVVRGTTSRPAENVPASDPMVRRSEGIAASPQAPAHGAGGLASGGTVDCGADLQDADDGGSCGSVRYCVGAGCETVSPQSNTGFVNATTRLNMAVELGGDEFDRNGMSFFTGQRRACHIKLFGLANCCKNSGLLIGLGNCSASERELAEERNAGNTHYLGRYCSKRTVLRRLHPPLAGLVRVRLQARADPAAAGPEPARHRLGQLPGAHGCRDRGYRLRRSRSVGVHAGPDGRVAGAVGLAAGRGRHRHGHADARP